jgi:hypothetical protein
VTGATGGGHRRTNSAASVEWGPVEFAHFEVTCPVPLPLTAVQEFLRIHPEQVLHLAYDELSTGVDQVIYLTVHPALSGIGLPVRVESSTPMGSHHPGAVIAIRWTPTRYGRVVPTMEADLAVVPAGPEASTLVLHCQYRPPLGLAGLVLDRLLGRFVAATTTTTFIVRLADALAKA